MTRETRPADQCGSGGLAGAEVCLYVAAAIFAAQALVILTSPAVALARQPAMVC